VLRARIYDLVPVRELPYGPAAPSLHQRPDRWQHPTTCRYSSKTACISRGVHRWVHVFRYIVLYLYVAQREGYAISDTAVAELVIGDLAGALIAALGIIFLRLRWRLGLALAGLVVIASIADVAGGTYLRSIEPPRPDAAGVWWLIFVFFAPLIVVSLPLIVWQLIIKRDEPLANTGSEAAEFDHGATAREF
jgi:hypothetical protein